MIEIFLYVFAFFIPFIVFIGLGIFINNHCGPTRGYNPHMLNSWNESSLLQYREYTYFWQLHPFLFFLYIIFSISAGLTFYILLYGGA